jgi:hypothetical protein
LRTSRSLLYIELTLATALAALFLLTLVSRDWIEEVFGVEPDAGSGALEWAIVAGLAILAIALALGARHEWRRLHTPQT